MSISALALAGLEAALNRCLDLDAGARERMTALHGSVIAFEILGLGRTIYLLPAPGKVRLLEDFAGRPDCTLRGSPLGLARMSDPRAGPGQLFSGQVEISGDTELARRLGVILGSMEFDWEEQLSRLTGDIFAHKAGNLFRRAGRWGAESALTLKLDIREYLQEELRLLPGPVEMEEFLAAVDTLRDDAERLQARVALLRKHTRGEHE